MLAAWKRVKSNGGSAGADGMSIQDTAKYLQTHLPRIRQELLDGTYRPVPVRRVEIPKPGGGTRQLGIPTVVDRLIQQALLQVLQPLIDPTFSEYSYGFRPNRSAHDAIRQAHQYVKDGYAVVVDIDLSNFFDRVNHDILMDRLRKRIKDEAVLRLIRRYLNADIMANGVKVERTEGTPQGGPLSPLLSNVMLDEIDRELERSGHKFARYADDCNIYVRSHKAGERVMARMRKLYGRLHLVVNEEKSSVDFATRRKFLGYSFYIRREARLRVAPKAIEAYKTRIRQITRRSGGRSLNQVIEDLQRFIPGWKTYFQLAETATVFSDLDSWLRRRLRCLQLKQWKRGTTAYKAAVALGHPAHIAVSAAGTQRRWWAGSNDTGQQAVMSVKYFDGLGVPRLGKTRAELRHSRTSTT
jgi:group II intron reverse transcriptase/maturase